MHILSERRINLSFDGRLKLLYLFFVLCLVLFAKSLFFLLLVFGSHFVLLLACRVKPKELLKFYTEPLFIALMFLIIKGVSFSPLGLNGQGVGEGFFVFLRVLTAFSLFLLTFFSFSFTELLSTLNQFRIPSLFIELLLLTHRFILLLHEEFLTIYLAQRNRLGFTGIKTYCTSVKAITEALFFRTLEHGENAILSMRQRGYDFKFLLSSPQSLQPMEIVFFSGMMVAWLFLFLLLQG